MREYPILKLTCPKTGRTVYCEWVSSCDAPGRSFKTEEEVLSHWQRFLPRPFQSDYDKYPEEIAEANIERRHHEARNLRRLSRLRQRGHTLLDNHDSPEKYASFNRCGPKGGSVGIPALVAELLEQAS